MKINKINCSYNKLIIIHLFILNEIKWNVSIKYIYIVSVPTPPQHDSLHVTFYMIFSCIMQKFNRKDEIYYNKSFNPYIFLSIHGYDKMVFE